MSNNVKKWSNMISGSYSVRIRQLHVPMAIYKGSPIQLHCEFELQHSMLYSVKYYKNYIEFYRYLPSHVPSAQTYNLKGTYVDLNKSNASHVIFSKTDLDSQGTYSCEVSTEAPDFSTVKAEKQMKVYILPEDPLRIEGTEPTYEMHNLINLTCISGASFPAQNLVWYINDEKASTKNLIYYSNSNKPTNALLQVSKLGLRLTANDAKFRKGSLKLVCQASLTLIYEYETSQTLSGGTQPRNKLLTSSGVDEHYSNLNNDNYSLKPNYLLTSSNNSLNHEQPIKQIMNIHSNGQDENSNVITWKNDLLLMKVSRDAPLITGGKERYRVGSILNINCSATADAHLSWYIKNKKANETQLVYYSNVNPCCSILGLKFRMQNRHFQMQELKLTCKATHFKKIVSYNKQLLIRTIGASANSKLKFEGESRNKKLWRIQSINNSIFFEPSLIINSQDFHTDFQTNDYPPFTNYDSYLTAPQYAAGSKRSPNNHGKNLNSNKFNVENPKIFNVGAVLDKDELVQDFIQVIDSIYYEPNVLPPNVNLYPFNLILNRNPIQAVQDVCDKLIKNQVYAVIVKDGNNPESLAVTQTCNFYNIPVIGISNRESSMSDKHMHSAYMRMVPPYSHQVNVWIEVLKHLKYKNVVFIHSADYDGRTSFTKFQALADKNHIEILSVIEYEPLMTNISNELEQIDHELKSRVYLLYTNKEDAQSIFVDVNRLNLTQNGYVWLISEQALEATNVPNGALGIQAFNSTNESGYIRDALYIIGLAIRELYKKENITSLPPSYCGEIGKNNWKLGDKLFNILRKQVLLFGKTGRVAFDGKGDRIDADYEIINYIYNRKVIVGNYAFSQSKMQMQLWLNENSIIWPGFQNKKPVGYYLPNKLKIVTIAEKPFLWSRPLDYQTIDNLRQHVNDLSKKKKFPVINAFNKTLNVLKTYNSKNSQQNNQNLNLFNQQIIFDENLIEQEFCNSNELLCTKYDEVSMKNNFYCCKGYCIDFLKTLATRLNISFSLYQVTDDQYGSFEIDKKTNKKKWNGLIGEIVMKKADLIVAPLTINPERSLFIDFSKPFKYQGITIISKQQLKSRSSLASFMEPFEDSLWIFVMISVHVVALVLYLLDRFSPFGRYRLPNCDIIEEDALNLSSAIWFAWGVLLNSGIGESSPRSFGGRLLGMIWAGFAIIIIASYTGNLAAFLVLNRPETALSGINDSRFRNPTENYTYSTVKNSAIINYFKRQVELSNIYNHIIKNKQLNTVEAGIEAVRNNEINAFIWDSARLEYEASQDCELSIASEQFGKSGYGIGLSKNSFWTEKVNEAILSMHESGYMERLDNEWILNPNPDCVNKDTLGMTLGLKNMAGVFILVGMGIVGGIGLILIEWIYKNKQSKSQKQLEKARYAADKWKKYIQRKKKLQLNLKQTREKQVSNSQSKIGKIKRAEFANSRTNEEFQSVCTDTRVLSNEATTIKSSLFNLPELHQEVINYNTSLDRNLNWQNSSQGSKDFLINETIVKHPLYSNSNKNQVSYCFDKTSKNFPSDQQPSNISYQKIIDNNYPEQIITHNKYASLNQLEQENVGILKHEKKKTKVYSHPIRFNQLKHQQAINEMNNYETSYHSVYDESYCDTNRSHAQSTIGSFISLPRNSQTNLQLIKPPHVLSNQKRTKNYFPYGYHN
uniref:Glutamate [NMDA] receptor subunit 1 n=1 Tax=Polyphagotarsonemus latus TaxID=1204166 RepID=A0AAN0N7N0_9ACAR